MIRTFNKIYNFKINEFEKDEVVRVRIGNLVSFLGFLVSQVYGFFYLIYLDSFISFFISEVFAFLYLLSFYFVSKNTLLKARFSFFIVFLSQLFFITIFYLSSKSGIQYFYLLAPPIAYLLFSKERELRFSISLFALLLLVICHFIGEKFYIVEVSENNINIIYVSTLIILFSVLMILFNTFLDEIKKKENKLEYLSKTDYLTNILNRRAFYSQAMSIIKLTERYGNELGLLVYDIDYFKKINDKYGHDIGDLVLKELSKQISNSIRSTDLFARFGGEEFIVLLPNISKKQLSYFAEKIREIAKELEVKDSNNEKLNITISIGVTLYYKGDDIESFIKRADVAMYEAKESGRDKVVSTFDLK